MEIKFDRQVLKVIKNLKKQFETKSKDVVNQVVEYATINAQNSFDKFYDEVPADDPYVFVTNTSLAKVGNNYERTIRCVGNQVLFIEFGAGQYYYTEAETRLYDKYLGGLDHRGKPKVYDIGHYGGGNSRGQDDLWFYKSQTGRESENAHYVKENRNGEPIMITHGNRPARALYRAVGMAVRRLAEGKLK